MKINKILICLLISVLLNAILFFTLYSNNKKFTTEIDNKNIEVSKLKDDVKKMKVSVYQKKNNKTKQNEYEVQQKKLENVSGSFINLLINSNGKDAEDRRKKMKLLANEEVINKAIPIVREESNSTAIEENEIFESEIIHKNIMVSTNVLNESLSYSVVNFEAKYSDHMGKSKNESTVYIKLQKEGNTYKVIDYEFINNDYR